MTLMEAVSKRNTSAASGQLCHLGRSSISVALSQAQRKRSLKSFAIVAAQQKRLWRPSSVAEGRLHRSSIVSSVARSC